MFTDIHNHILPNVDDGPQSIEESIELLKQAKENNINKIYCTPHKHKFPFELTNNQVKTIYEQFIHFSEVQELEMNISLAHEVTIVPNLINELRKDNLFLLRDNESRDYILLELPKTEIPQYFDKMICDLIQLKVIPILVHPERNDHLKRDLQLIVELKKMGVQMQVNADSFIGRNGYLSKRFVYKMLRAKLIDYLASDAHNTKERGFCIDKVITKLNKKESYAVEKILNNMDKF